MGQGFHNVSLMCDLRRLLQPGLLCPKPFKGSWMLVACGSVLEECVATASSKSERDWLQGKSETPELEITGVMDKYVHMLNGTKWENNIVKSYGKFQAGMRGKKRRP